MVSLIEQLFGSYTPNYQFTGLAAVDFEWVAGVVIFCICLVGALKLLNCLMRGVRRDR